MKKLIKILAAVVLACLTMLSSVACGDSGDAIDQ